MRSLLRNSLIAAVLSLVMAPLISAAPSTTSAPAIRAIDAAGLKQVIASQHGKVVLVNLWATWCGPCVEEFPNLVRLYNRYHGQGLVVLAVSADEPATQSKVKPFLAAQKATFPAFVRKPGDVEAFINAIDPHWSGAVPATYLYDRNGHQVGSPLIGGQSYEKFAAAVQPLLGQGHVARR